MCHLLASNAPGCYWNCGEKSLNLFYLKSGQPVYCYCWWLGCYNIWTCCACCVWPTWRKAALFCRCLTVGCRLCQLMLFLQAAMLCCMRWLSNLHPSTFRWCFTYGSIRFPLVFAPDNVHTLAYRKFMASVWWLLVDSEFNHKLAFSQLWLSIFHLTSHFFHLHTSKSVNKW